MSRTPIHPGELLAEELDALSMSAAELARHIHVPANRISQILTGKRSITPDTALRLGKLFGTGPHYWLNLQALYELDVVEAAGHEDSMRIVPLQAPARKECPTSHGRALY